MKLYASKRSHITALLLGIVISVVWLGGITVGMTQTPTEAPLTATLPDVVVIGKRTKLETEVDPKSVLAVSYSADAMGILTTQ